MEREPPSLDPREPPKASLGRGLEVSRFQGLGRKVKEGLEARYLERQIAGERKRGSTIDNRGQVLTIVKYLPYGTEKDRKEQHRKKCHTTSSLQNYVFFLLLKKQKPY